MEKKRLFSNTVYLVTLTTILVNFLVIAITVGKIFSANGSIEIWLIGVFIVIICINIILGKGALRAAQVSARFSVDSLPVKKRSIEEELSTNAITSEEAEKKKTELQNEVDFYYAVNSTTKSLFKMNKAVIAVQSIIVLIFEALHRLNMTKIEVRYINDILICNIITQFLIMVILIKIGLVITRRKNIWP